MAEIVMGKDIITPMRLYENRFKEDATVLAFSTSDSHTIAPNSTTEKTKDGPVVTVDDTPEETFSKTVFMETGDSKADEFIEGARAGKTVELWDINLANPVIDEATGEETGKYWGTYYQGKITNVSIDAPADGKAELTFEYAAEGIGKKGACDVSDKDIDRLYNFTNTLKLEGDDEDGGGIVGGTDDDNGDDEDNTP